MAPARKRGGAAKAAAAAERKQWKVGDLVLAKVKGFPPWPAEVSTPEDWGHSQDSKKIFVYFFGTNQIGFCNPDAIQPFTQEKKKTLLLKCQGKETDFGRAVEEISSKYDKQNEEQYKNEAIIVEDFEDASEKSSLRKFNRRKGSRKPTSGREIDSQIPNESVSFATTASIGMENGRGCSETSEISNNKTCHITVHRDEMKPGVMHAKEDKKETMKCTKRLLARRNSSENECNKEVCRRENEKQITVTPLVETIKVDVSESEKRINVSKKDAVKELENNLSENTNNASAGEMDDTRFLCTQNCIMFSEMMECGDSLKHAQTDATLTEQPHGYDKNKQDGDGIAVDESVHYTYVFKKKRKHFSKSDTETQTCSEKSNQFQDEATLNVMHSPLMSSSLDSKFNGSKHGIDNDDHLPLVKRVRARLGKEFKIRQDGLKDNDYQNSERCSQVDNRFQPMVSHDRDTFDAENGITGNAPSQVPDQIISNERDLTLPLKADKYRFRSSLADDEATLPPSKRLHRALEAMSAFAKEDPSVSEESNASGDLRGEIKYDKVCNNAHDSFQECLVELRKNGNVTAKKDISDPVDYNGMETISIDQPIENTCMSECVENYQMSSRKNESSRKSLEERMDAQLGQSVCKSTNDVQHMMFSSDSSEHIKQDVVFTNADIHNVSKNKLDDSNSYVNSIELEGRKNKSFAKSDACVNGYDICTSECCQEVLGVKYDVPVDQDAVENNLKYELVNGVSIEGDRNCQAPSCPEESAKFAHAETKNEFSDFIEVFSNNGGIMPKRNSSKLENCLLLTSDVADVKSSLGENHLCKKNTYPENSINDMAKLSDSSVLASVSSQKENMGNVSKSIDNKMLVKTKITMNTAGDPVGATSTDNKELQTDEHNDHPFQSNVVHSVIETSESEALPKKELDILRKNVKQTSASKSNKKYLMKDQMMVSPENISHLKPGHYHEVSLKSKSTSRYISTMASNPHTSKTESSGYTPKLFVEEGDSMKKMYEAEKEVQLSTSYNSSLSATSASLKHLIAAAHAKRQLKLSNASPSSNSRETEKHILLRATSTSPSQYARTPTVISESSDEGKSSSRKRYVRGTHDCNTEAIIARDSFEGMLETLSRTKESIARATRVALECAKHGLAGEVIDLLVHKLECETNCHRKVDLFFLVDSITQCSHAQKGIAGDAYSVAVQTALPRLLSAAAPGGNATRENRRQCLKVLRLWLERKILPESILRKHINELENSDDRVNTSSKRPSRAIDDPLRDIEGMLDEYGSNASFQLSGFILPQVSEDEEETPACYGDKLGNSSSNKGMESFHEPTKRSPVVLEKHCHVLEDVEGELEMEDVSPSSEYEANCEHAVAIMGAMEDSILNGANSYPCVSLEQPPPPSEPPPLPPPLPSSPPPPSPPPPPPPSSPLPQPFNSCSSSFTTHTPPCLQYSTVNDQHQHLVGTPNHIHNGCMPTVGMSSASYNSPAYMMQGCSMPPNSYGYLQNSSHGPQNCAPTQQSHVNSMPFSHVSRPLPPAVISSNQFSYVGAEPRHQAQQCLPESELPPLVSSMQPSQNQCRNLYSEVSNRRYEEQFPFQNRNESTSSHTGAALLSCKSSTTWNSWSYSG